MNFFPLCTAMVCPTISGTIVERRDHVFTTFFSNRLLSSSIFFIRWSSTNGPFFTDRPKFPSSSLALAPLHDKLVRLLVIARLIAPRRLAPRGHGMASSGGLALATAQRMIDRIHRHAAHGRANAHPALAARLADRDVLVVEIPDLPDRCHAVDVDHPDFTRRQPNLRVLPLL